MSEASVKKGVASGQGAAHLKRGRCSSTWSRPCATWRRSGWSCSTG